MKIIPRPFEWAFSFSHWKFSFLLRLIEHIIFQSWVLKLMKENSFKTFHQFTMVNLITLFSEKLTYQTMEKNGWVLQVFQVNKKRNLIIISRLKLFKGQMYQNVSLKKQKFQRKILCDWQDKLWLNIRFPVHDRKT
jgi:hypothetical protein